MILKLRIYMFFIDNYGVILHFSNSVFTLSLVSLHGSFGFIISKSAPPFVKQCNLATKSHEVNYAST